MQSLYRLQVTCCNVSLNWRLARTGFAIPRSLAVSRWQTLRPMKIPYSPDIQATRNGHAQARKAATTRLHSTLSNSGPSLHTSMNTYRSVYKNEIKKEKNRKSRAVGHDNGNAHYGLNVMRGRWARKISNIMCSTCCISLIVMSAP